MSHFSELSITADEALEAGIDVTNQSELVAWLGKNKYPAHQINWIKGLSPESFHNFFGHYGGCE